MCSQRSFAGFADFFNSCELLRPEFHIYTSGEMQVPVRHNGSLAPIATAHGAEGILDGRSALNLKWVATRCNVLLLLGAIAVSAGTVPKHIDTLEQEGIVPTKRAVVPASSTARLNEKKRPTAAKNVAAQAVAFCNSKRTRQCRCTQEYAASSAKTLP